MFTAHIQTIVIQANVAAERQTVWLAWTLVAEKSEFFCTARRRFRPTFFLDNLLFSSGMRTQIVD